MKIKKIQLKNFRNFEKKEVVFSQKNNVILGKNAVGKTTILESIFFSGFTRSPRSFETDNLINKKQEFFSLKCFFDDDKKENEVFLSYSKGVKKVIFNGLKVSKISDYIGSFGVVYYQPNEIVDFLSTPQNRRKGVDLAFSQISTDYLGSLKLYNRLMKERNMALKTAKNSFSRQSILLVEMLTEKMVEAMKPVILQRMKFCEDVNGVLENIHLKFNASEKLVLKYLPNMNIEDLSRINKEVVMKDIQSEVSSFGVHKDDFVFYINENEITKCCSQGQQKSAILSFKLAIAEVFKKYRNEYPVLLLDDALSELDSRRQNSLFGLINPEMQMILSTTSLKEINKDFLEKANIIEIKKGEDLDE